MTGPLKQEIRILRHDAEGGLELTVRDGAGRQHVILVDHLAELDGITVKYIADQWTAFSRMLEAKNAGELLDW